MAKVAEGTFQVDDASFYCKTWTPDSGHVKARLVFVHGFSEHINRYNDFFPRLTAQGIEVLGWDQRGWGRSVRKPAERGLTGPTSQVLRDVAAFVQDKLNDGSNAPLFIMGHSMGGGEILMLAADKAYSELTARVRGWIVECPLIGFPPGGEPPRLKIMAGRLLGRLVPRQQLKHVVPPERLSRDAAIVESVRNDELCHNTGTLEGLASLLDRTALLASGQVKLGQQVRSLLLAHGTGDLICSHDMAVAFVRQQSVDDVTVKSYHDAFHQLHADHCKDEFTRDLAAWILERCDNEIVKPEIVHPGALGAKL
ncbi:hypothetical protein CDD82_7907 [Ophiocordyceps australis]|uniref:Serine aminopeptidase S33 domain-containing protein n=1 Tax=Ophiocordyceps australis TaxID=1399860 RepID=A0A2C5YNB7_9HYPO|nr:hypothetical protein CDD82_7907 [Ophiocordyceps australis]